MTRSRHATKSPADPAAAHLEISLYPYRDDTAATVTLVAGVGTRVSRLRLWRGHLTLNRSDLRGASGRQCAILLCGELLYALGRPDSAEIARETGTSRAASSAPLEGPQGESWIQLDLQYDLPYTHTPPGIAHV